MTVISEGDEFMPPPAPLAMAPQRLDASPVAPFPGPRGDWSVRLARAFVLGFSIAITGALGLIFLDWFHADGLRPVEAGIIFLAMFTAFGITLSVATSLLGCLPRKGPVMTSGTSLDIALLMPLYGESVRPVFTNLAAMLGDIDKDGSPHRHTLYILSDTRDPEQVRQETRAIGHLRAMRPGWAVHYRHRALNTRFKQGNIAHWVATWGAAHDAMLVLDADSVMSGSAIRALADAMGADTTLGLVQSVPRLIRARSVFARTQQFANTVYGATLARGLSLWSGNAANYWGHNALIRVAAFAAHAGLPDLPGRRPFGGVILSHDFVEAALLRRAGWSVRFLPQARDSFEATPPTVMAHALRDRRWCQGNLQHLRLLRTCGLHLVSRVHLLQGAMAYIASVGWFALLVLWVLVGIDGQAGVIRYFSEANPMIPTWPSIDLVSRILILILIYGLLIAPRLIGAIMFWINDPRLETAGGHSRFWLSFLIELAISVALAPMMMIQHLVAVGRTLLGRDTGWRPQRTEAPAISELLRFHAAEIALGCLLAVLFWAGVVSLWLAPIAVCLGLAPILSWATGFEPRWARALLLTPQEVQPPEVLTQAGTHSTPFEAPEAEAVPAQS